MTHHTPLIALLVAGGLVGGLAACDRSPAPADRTVLEADDSADSARDAAGDAMDATREAADTAMDATRKAADATADAAGEMGDRASAALETMDVKAALIADQAVDASDINVDTDRETRTVVLRGSVPTEVQKAAAERIARAQAPDYTIENRLVISPISH